MGRQTDRRDGRNGRCLWCGAEAARRRWRLIDVELTQDIRAYNEVDCKAMTEIVRYLREEQ